MEMEEEEVGDASSSTTCPCAFDGINRNNNKRKFQHGIVLQKLKNAKTTSTTNNHIQQQQQVEHLQLPEMIFHHSHMSLNDDHNHYVSTASSVDYWTTTGMSSSTNFYPSFDSSSSGFQQTKQSHEEDQNLVLGGKEEGVISNHFVLSSGRWDINQDTQHEKLTIDKEFEQYFSMLML